MKEGEQVLCIDSGGRADKLMKGGVYTILSSDEYRDPEDGSLILSGVIGCRFYKRRFMSLPDEIDRRQK